MINITSVRPQGFHFNTIHWITDSIYEFPYSVRHIMCYAQKFKKPLLLCKALINKQFAEALNHDLFTYERHLE